jgi:hypothetical protein
LSVFRSPLAAGKRAAQTPVALFTARLERTTGNGQRATDTA